MAPETQPDLPSGVEHPSTGDSRSRAWLVGAAIAAVFGIWRSHVLFQPPVWDGAMGVTPAALTLEGLGFDLAALLGMPDYRAGGPNLHGTSLYTWLVAALIRLLGGYAAALPVLHLISFGLLGALATAVFRLVRRATGDRGLATAAAVLMTLFPPMVVQASDVYLDLPLAVAATWSLVLFLEGSRGKASVAACLAAAVKPTAIILVPVMGMILIAQRDRSMRARLLLFPPVLVAVAPVLVDGALRSAATGPPVTVASVTGQTLEYLGSMPVTLALVGTVTIVFVLRRAEFDRPAREVVVAALLLGSMFLAFFCLNPILTKGVPALPRYVTLVAPMFCAALVTGLAAAGGRTVAWVGSLSFLTLFALNLYGDLEPPSGNIFPLAERSLAYEELLSVQEEAFAHFEVVAQSTPSYYDHFAHFRFAYPQSGWATGVPPSGTPVWLGNRPELARLEGKPDRFVMLLETPWLGGFEIALLKERATQSPQWTVETERFEKGEFSNEVILVTRTPGPSVDQAGAP